MSINVSTICKMLTGKIRMIIILSVTFQSCIVYAQGTGSNNPIVQNGVATFVADINIGQKFLVPDEWRKVVIKENVTVTGSFYMPERTKAIEIAGESRTTSIIKGDGSRPVDDGKKGRTYSAIRCDKSPDLYVHDLRSLNPMKFHIHGGFGNVTVERCDLIEDRGIHTTDGVHGGIGLVTVKDCYINTWDDAVYVTECKLVENTTIVHNKNGAPFQVTWGHKVNGEICIIRNYAIVVFTLMIRKGRREWSLWSLSQRGIQLADRLLNHAMWKHRRFLVCEVSH